MKSRDARTGANRQIIEEASTWFVDFRIGDIDARAREEFHQWLRRSPDHIQAYMDIASTYAELPSSSLPRKRESSDEYDVEALIARARTDSNIESFPRTQDPSDAAHAPRNTAKRAGYALAATALLAVAGLGTWAYSQSGVYTTDIGEQRSITLDDGSTVDLNARTKVRVRLAAHQRDVELVRGQAFFEVAHDAGRPFIVASNNTRVRAVGTKFDVYNRASGTQVTVIEGKVAVTDSRSPKTDLGSGDNEREARGHPEAAGEILLTADEQVTIPAVNPEKPRIQSPTRVDPAIAIAWKQRQLIFENATLTDVAEEFNRYSARPLIVELQGLENFHVSGIYSATNPDSLLRFLRVQPGIRIVESDREIRVTHE